MNRDDQFEKRLQRQPLREIPPAWRKEILSLAEAAAGSRQSSSASRSSSWWRELFWPCPQAWAALATVWLVILGASFVSRETPSISSRQLTPPSPQLRELLKQQGQLLAELVGPIEKPDADRPKSSAPRSQRREEFLNA